MKASALLRGALVGDAIVSGAAGLLMVAAAGPLRELLDVPMQLLRAAGLLLLPYSLALILLSRRSFLPTLSVRVVIAANVLWALASAIVLYTGTLQPNALGYVFVVGQALVVAAFAELQYVGLRKAAAVAA